MITVEALANGTPVIGFNHGSVPEIIVDQKTGVIVNDIEHAVKAVEKLRKISRSVCREVFEQSFTASVMAERCAYMNNF
jgi:glycosyltransferase involved in cell wall biosynthesis